jgi:ParB-like chromosome segregation protein Spo0J
MSAAQGAPQTIDVALKDLAMDPAIQVRQRLSQPTISRYADAMRAGQAFPPIKVAYVDGACYLIGGWHRVEAAKVVGLTSLTAELIDAPKSHLAWLAADDNLRHGLPLNRGREAKAAFKAYVTARRHRTADVGYKSYRQIAQDLHGLRSHETIRNWMRAEYPAVYRAMAGEREEETNTAPLNSPQPDPLAAARDYLQQVAAMARGITDPDRRGELIAMMDDARRTIDAAGPWTPYDLGF